MLTKFRNYTDMRVDALIEEYHETCSLACYDRRERFRFHAAGLFWSRMQSFLEALLGERSYV